MAENAPMGQVVSLRLNDEDDYRLRQLMNVHGMSRSDVVRHLIRTAPLLSIRMETVTTAPYGDSRCTCCPIHTRNP